MQLRSPFLCHNGRWYLVPSFGRNPTDEDLQQLLAALLERFPPSQLLILRPMAPAEVKLLEQYRSDFDAEAFARMCFTEDKRLGWPTARKGRGGP